MSPYRFITPLFLICATFGATFLTWYFVMPDQSVLTGLAPRNASPYPMFLFRIFFIAMLAGIYFVNRCYIPSGNWHLSDRDWLATALVSTIIALGADAYFLRGAFTGGGFQSDSIALNITGFAAQAKENAVLGLSSFNNLFPVPASIGAMLMFSNRPLKRRYRLYAALLFSVIAADTLAHSALGLGRIWFLSILFTTYIAWVVQKRPSITRQLFTIAIAFLFATTFIVGIEYIRSVGVAAYRENVDLSDSRLLNYVLTRLAQAYIASNMNNALIVLDCHPAMQMISTLDVPARIAQNFFGAHFRDYGECPEWKSAFGTLNFLALLWWDWGYAAILIAFSIGALIQYHFISAIRASTQNLGFAAVALPNTLLACMHFTTANFVGSTEFLLPLGFITALFLLTRLDGFSSAAGAANSY